MLKFAKYGKVLISKVFTWKEWELLIELNLLQLNKKKEPLGCVVYSHCPTNDSYNKSIHSYCLPCNYVAKPSGILQRVIKSQRVYTLERSLSKKRLVRLFILVKLKMSHVVCRGTLTLYFEKTYFLCIGYSPPAPFLKDSLF